MCSVQESILHGWPLEVLLWPSLHQFPSITKYHLSTYIRRHIEHTIGFLSLNIFFPRILYSLIRLKRTRPLKTMTAATYIDVLSPQFVRVMSPGRRPVGVLVPNNVRNQSIHLERRADKRLDSRVERFLLDSVVQFQICPSVQIQNSLFINLYLDLIRFSSI